MTGLICPCGESVPSSQRKLAKPAGAGKAKQTTCHVSRDALLTAFLPFN
jgi:hypothetical protein